MEGPALQSDPFADLMAQPAVIAAGESIWLRYSYATGQARTGTLTADGIAIVLRDFPLDPAWSSVAALGGGRVAFLNHTTRMLTIGEVGLDGTFSDAKNNEHVDLAHTMIAVFDDLLLFYLVEYTESGYRGSAFTGRVSADGSFTRLSEPYQWDFWTHIVPVGDGLVFFYNSYSHLAATGRVTGDGGFADLQTFPGFDPWIRIVAGADQTLLFYNAITGAAASGRVEADGSFVNLTSAFLGPGLRLVATRDGRIVIFRLSDVLVARFPVNGWFFDARRVNGLITPPPELFVR